MTGHRCTFSAFYMAVEDQKMAMEMQPQDPGRLFVPSPCMVYIEHFSCRLLKRQTGLGLNIQTEQKFQKEEECIPEYYTLSRVLHFNHTGPANVRCKSKK